MKRKHKIRIDSILKPLDTPTHVSYTPTSSLIGVLTDLQKGLGKDFEFSVIETNNDNKRMYCIFKCKNNAFEKIKNLLLDQCGTKFNFNFKPCWSDWRV